jgi:hypothetical protein
MATRRRACNRIGNLGGDFLVGEVRRARTQRSMLNRDRTDISLSVDVKNGVLVEIAGFRN